MNANPDRHIILRLVDPGGVVALAANLKEECLESAVAWYGGRYVKFYIYITRTGQLWFNPHKGTINATMGLPLGTVTWRSKKRQLAFKGMWFSDFWDELVEAFASVGLTAVQVKERARANE